MYRSLRRLLFLLPPECAHDLALHALSLAPCRPESSKTPSTVMGMEFPNRIGLAAGFDKTGAHADIMARLGFGFIEVGTITPEPQSGNNKPRVFRLPREESLINRLGFNNPGMEQALANIRNLRRNGYVLGINIGKGRDTPIEDAAEDYVKCLGKLHSQGDYFTLNVSSPNTESLRDLQYGKALSAFLSRILSERDSLLDGTAHKPIMVKLSPDWKNGEMEETCRIIGDSGIDGVIVSNTTLQRPKHMEGIPYSNEQGGLSGSALAPLSREAMTRVRKALPDKIALIACGGISTPEDAMDRLNNGADLVQLYTGLIYQGPDLVRRLVNAEQRHAAVQTH